VVNTFVSLVFAFIAIYAVAMTYRRILDRPQIEAMSQAQRIDPDAEAPTPIRDRDTARNGRARRRRRTFAALSVAGAALITYRRHSRRRAK
jgi:hypothetical protein